MSKWACSYIPRLYPRRITGIIISRIFSGSFIQWSSVRSCWSIFLRTLFWTVSVISKFCCTMYTVLHYTLQCTVNTILQYAVYSILCTTVYSEKCTALNTVYLVQWKLYCNIDVFCTPDSLKQKTLITNLQDIFQGKNQKFNQRVLSRH